MPGEFADSDTARHSAPIEYDKARHPLTIDQAVELFDALGVPRSKRSVQRFCKQEHLDCVSIKGARGDQFFINRESVERYAEELRQIEAVAAIGDAARYDAPQRAVARTSAPERDSTPPPVEREPEPIRGAAAESEATIKRLEGENLNLRIDNRGKETAINFLTMQLKDKDQHLQDLSYRLGAAESRLAQLEAPKNDGDAARQTAPEPAQEPVEAMIMTMPTPSVESTPSPDPDPGPPQPEPRRSFFGRLLG